MNKKISIYQLFTLMLLLPYGSASLFFLAPKTKQDVWIALLLYSLVGIFLQIIYITLYEKYPQDTLITYLPKIYGKFIGTILSTAYIAYFIYATTRVFRDFVELISAFSIPNTPKILFAVIFTINIIYGTYKGIENLASLSQLFIISLLSSKALSLLLILATGNIFKLHNLEPILSNGFFYVIKNSWQLIFFPYGETLAFTMFYPYVIENEKIKKAAVASIILEAILLCFNNILFICTLGVKFATLTNFPLLETYRLIQIGDFLSRLDIIFLIVFMLEGLFKISLFLYAASLGASQLFKFKDESFWCIPLGIIVFILSFFIAKNYPQHIKLGLVDVIIYVHMPMQLILPSLTLIVYYVKKLTFKKSRT